MWSRISDNNSAGYRILKGNLDLDIRRILVLNKAIIKTNKLILHTNEQKENEAAHTYLNNAYKSRITYTINITCNTLSDADTCDTHDNFSYP